LNQWGTFYDRNSLTLKFFSQSLRRLKGAKNLNVYCQEISKIHEDHTGKYAYTVPSRIHFIILEDLRKSLQAITEDNGRENDSDI